jgi:hypothetical protein
VRNGDFRRFRVRQPKHNRFVVYFVFDVTQGSVVVVGIAGGLYEEKMAHDSSEHTAHYVIEWIDRDQFRKSVKARASYTRSALKMDILVRFV